MNPLAEPLSTTLSRRRLLGLGVGASAAAVLAACGGSSTPGGSTSGGKKYSGKYEGPAVTLAYWNGFTGGDGPYMKKMVDEFNSSQDKITVKMTTLQWSDYYTKVPTALQSGKGPDVGIAHIDQLPTMAARKSIVPLDDVATDLKLEESDFIPAIWKAGVYQDKRYGIPLDVHSLAMYANKADLGKAKLAALPANGQEFEAAVSSLRGAGVAAPFWMPTLWPAHLIFLSLLYQNGGLPYGEDGAKATFGSDQGVTALTWMADQVKKGYSPKNVAIDTQYNAFKTNKNTITWDGVWQINDLKTTAPNVQWELGPVPTIGDTPAVWASGHNFVLMRQQKTDDNRTQASKAFIDYISSRSQEWANSGMIPARNTEREKPEVQKLPQLAVAKSGVDVFKYSPPVPGLGDVQAQTLEKAVNKGVLGQQSPKQALAEAQSAATKLLEENRKKFGG